MLMQDCRESYNPHAIVFDAGHTSVTLIDFLLGMYAYAEL